MARQIQVVKTDLPSDTFSMEADQDYVLARLISFLGMAYQNRAGYFSQAACEKYMKALMVQERKCFLQTHNLLSLADACKAFDPYFADDKMRLVLKQFDAFEQVGRYGAASKHDPLSKKTPTLQTAGVWVWEDRYLSDLDAFVFKVRGLLNFQRPGLNILAAILAKDQNNLFVAGWNGPPLADVLTKRNRYFSSPPQANPKS